MAASDWITEWLVYHQDLHPHRAWVSPHTEEGARHYEGWVESLDRRGVTRAEADAASRRLQELAPGFPDKHLKAIVEAVGEMRRERATEAGAYRPDDAPPPGLVQASVRSADCPECQGSGWARRRILWHSIPRPFLVDLFCRCEAGAWREANDPDLIASPYDRVFDDLQAHPELWDPELSHPNWPERPVPAYLRLDPQARYLAPGEPAPAPAVRPAEALTSRRRREGLGPLPPFVSADPSVAHKEL